MRPLNRAFLLFLVGFVFSVTTHADDKRPTELPTPAKAQDVKRMSVMRGAAYETLFTLHSEFPANPSLELYSKALGQPWVSCTWGEATWSHFIDGTKNPAMTVHQWLHMWINEKARRTIVLSVRYLSSDKCAEDRPENNEQHVVVAEYFDQEISEVLSNPQLACGSKTAGGDSRTHGRP
jgi:hypothetical protein